LDLGQDIYDFEESNNKTTIYSEATAVVVSSAFKKNLVNTTAAVQNI